MDNISNIDDLCVMEACVHRKHIFIILSTSSLSYSSPEVSSTLSKTSLISYSFQTCDSNMQIDQYLITFISSHLLIDYRMLIPQLLFNQFICLRSMIVMVNIFEFCTFPKVVRRILNSEHIFLAR